LSLPQWYSVFIEAVDAALDKVLPDGEIEPRQLHAAMRYSVFPGGKRIRPAVVCASRSAVAGPKRSGNSRSDDPAMWPSVAIELIHCYSLIHDDLPCMDNDDFRRGKPSCHKAYGEATALLAGDALLTLAFEALASPSFLDAVGPEPACSCVAALASAAGSRGMIGGQQLDISPWPWLEPGIGEPEALCLMEALKTGKLFQCAAVMGGIVGGACEEELGILSELASDLGLAFQIRDDLEDAVSEGEGAQPGIITAVSVWGVEGAQQHFVTLIDAARTKCRLLGNAGSELMDIIDLVNREW
jgi:geranylgeranyl diphosphate synthase type II